MENGLQNGVRTNHDRDPWANGVNGRLAKHEMSSDKGKSLVADMPNGGDGSMMDVDSEPYSSHGTTMVMANHTRMDDLPDEIQHITTDILPLGLIISRLAQFSHTKLMDQIAELAAKPLPQGIMNGNSNYQFTGGEDTSNESLDKKVSLLRAAQDLHTRWVKALVIAEWSKKADKVSRLIDIRAHLANKLDEFNVVMWNMIKAKQDLHWARLPSPDLKTALEVLSSDDISWMPELGYVEPPPLTLQEKLSWIENINTILNVRLSYDEYEKIPVAFRDYSIDNGRVTFKVQGEFEVDLTIGDEDPEKQFWFIDLRFLFTPAPADLAEPVRAALEAKVNQVLGTDGLAGCYRYLHEFVLTQKITEFWRQAVELSRERWIETLSVERLNRAMAVQYWTSKPHSQGSKSWIILGINSNNGPDGLPDPKTPSCLVLRWFRDNKEVKGFDISFDVDRISTESLLRAVIASHVEHLLTTIYSKLAAKPRFSQRHARLALEISKNEPSDSQLTLQLFDHESVFVKVEGMTGAFTMLPPSQLIQDGQRKLNSSPNPAEDGPTMLESLRCYYAMKDLSSRARSIGWNMARGPISTEELKVMVQSASQSREVFHPIWLRKVGWMPPWFVIVTMSLGGDQWWLVELAPQNAGSQGVRMKMFSKIPMASNQLSVSDEFFQNLTIYVSGIISHVTDFRELHAKRMPHTARLGLNYSLPPQIKLPTIFVRLSDMLRPRDNTKELRPTPWAKEFIPIVFKGVQTPSDDQDMDGVSPQLRRDARIKIIAEARLSVTDKARFQLLKGNVDHDVAFDSRAGQFTLRLRADMGTPVVALLAARVRSLERLVDFVGSIRRAGKNVVAESVTLREVIFTYRSGGTDDPAAALPNPPQEDTRGWRVRLDLAKDKRVKVTLEPGNPHLRVLDFLTQSANSPELEALPSWLLSTLPLFRAVARIEAAWATLTANGGAFYVFHKGLSWLTLRFIITPGSRRLVNLDIKPRIRKGKRVWHVSRAGFGDAKSRNDEFDRALHQKVWTARGDGIKGLGTSAAADTEKGIERLLDLVDQTIRSMIGTPPPAPGPLGGGAAQDAASGPPASAAPTQHQAPQSMQQAAQAQAQARLAQQQALRQQQANAQNQMHQRGGGGMGIGSSNSPVVVLD